MGGLEKPCITQLGAFQPVFLSELKPRGMSEGRVLPAVVLALRAAACPSAFLPRCRVLRVVLLHDQWRGAGADPPRRLQVSVGTSSVPRPSLPKPCCFQHGQPGDQPVVLSSGVRDPPGHPGSLCAATWGMHQGIDICVCAGVLLPFEPKAAQISIQHPRSWLTAPAAHPCWPQVPRCP